MVLPIETERLVIRESVRDDAEPLLAIHLDPEVNRWLGGAPQTLADELKRVDARRNLQREHGFSLWTVDEKETGEVVGAAGLFPVELKGPDVEVAYHFKRDRWGRGYATEAASACIAYGFEVAGLDRIVGLVVPENLASARVLQKCGLTLEGTARHYGMDHNRYVIERRRSARPGVPTIAP